MRKIMPLVLVISAMTCCYAQDQQQQNSDTSPDSKPEVKLTPTLGIGLGLDFGGIGGRFTGPISRYFFLQFGAGYNLDGIGFNGGLGVNLSPTTKVRPVLFGMYGYNAVLLTDNKYRGITNKKTYYGPSFGFGLQFHGHNTRGNFFSAGLIVPVRNQHFKDDVDNAKHSGYKVTEPSPVNISFGYHFGSR